MIAGTLSPVLVIGPSVLAVFGASDARAWPDLAIATTLALVMLVIAVAGIWITARTQVAMGAAQYAILAGFAVAGLVVVLGHRPGTVPVTAGWFTLRRRRARQPDGGFLLAVFIYTGWDGTIYVNEEVRQRRASPGKAAVLAVTLVALIHVLSQVGLKGDVSPARLQANAPAALVYTAGVLPAIARPDVTQPPPRSAPADIPARLIRPARSAVNCAGSVQISCHCLIASTSSSASVT